MSNASDLGDWLQTAPVFRGLSQAQLAPLLNIAWLQTFAKGELVFSQGGEATGFFVIRAGKIKIFKVSAAGKEQILNVVEAGESFAEAAALDGKPFPASAAALEPTVLVFLPRQPLLALLHQHPDIAIRMLVSLAQHSRHLAEIIEELSFKDVPQRLAAYLLSLDGAAAAAGDRKKSTKTVELELTKSQLAAALGTIPATLSRAFYRLSSEGLIVVNGSRIDLIDCDRLQALSQAAAQRET